MARLPLHPVIFSITLRCDPDVQKDGYALSVFAHATVGGLITPIKVQSAIAFVDFTEPLPDIGLTVVTNEIQRFIDEASRQELQRHTDAVRRRLKRQPKPEAVKRVKEIIAETKKAPKKKSSAKS